MVVLFFILVCVLDIVQTFFGFERNEPAFNLIMAFIMAWCVDE
tara:strand:+ start:15227 stop:15355 length:129 start_codon:yes stop_codon:yes gene_type:complete